jgi:hypothetical protein
MEEINIKETYFWTAELTDKTQLCESFGNTIKDVFQANKDGKLRYFMLTSSKDINGKIIITIGGKRKLIYFIRRMNHVCNDFHLEWPLIMVGWEENVKGVAIKSIMYIYPSGGIELNNDEPTLSQAYHESLIKQLKESNPTKEGQSNAKIQST